MTWLAKLFLIPLIIGISVLWNYFNANGDNEDDNRNNNNKSSKSVATTSYKKLCDVTIVWASQSGTSTLFAEELKEIIENEFKEKKLNKTIEVLDMEDLAVTSLSHAKLVIFVVSTYGFGEPPSNGEGFWEDISKEDIDLSGLNFILYGLGDISYGDTYNMFSVTLKDRLESLGAYCLQYEKNCAHSGSKTTQFDKIKYIMVDTLMKAVQLEMQKSIEKEEETAIDAVVNSNPFISFTPK